RRVPAPALALGVADRRSHLTRRVHMLLLNPEPPRSRCRPLWTAGVALVAVGLLAGLSAVRLTAADAPKADASKDGKKPDAAKPAAKDAPKPETLNYFGVVTDKDTKKPIAGATVVVRRSTSNDRVVMEESKHTTDAAGKYTFVIPPEQVAKSDLYIELDVEHPEYAPAKGFGYALGMIRKNEQFGNRPFFESVELRPGQPVTGVVHTPDGKPAAGVKVMAYSVTSKRKQGEFEYGSFTDTKTDKDGKYRLTLTTPGWGVVWYLPEQYVPTTRVVNDKRGDLGTYTMRDGPRLSGKVLDAKGQPVAGVVVNAESQDRNDEITGPVADNINRAATTDAKGEFVMNPLPPGNYLVKPGEYARDASLGQPTPYSKKTPVPAVFLGTKVVLKADAKPEPVEVRAVPHVVIEGQYFDSKGQRCKGFGPFVTGRLDGEGWAAEAKCKDGKFVCHVPHGLEGVQLDLMTNEHHALRWRKKAGEPLNNNRNVQLGTLTDDVTGFEVVSYDAPILMVKVKSPDGVKAENVAVTAVYGEGKGQYQGIMFNSAKGRRSDVSFEGLAGGKYQSSQLFPDEEVTVIAYADGFASKPVKLKLAEGTTKEIEAVLEPAKDEPKKDEKK
ncbi:MAG: carboxypeptidase regulatory-like domain-containing protein, partial [Gemmataceae bacterium]|nr:carboxypeptidase regulatory-like domain-containing protein [Gemmataceae bacterium]